MGPAKQKEKCGNKGFTMIEVVAVLLVLGILAAVVVVRTTGLDQSDLISQIDVIKNHLRYAQARAMGSSSPWGVTFQAGAKTYFLFQGTAPSTPVLFLGEDSPTVSLTTKNSALTITSATLAPQTITFDAYGSPGAADITVTTNGGNILVTKNTGYIP